MDIRGGIVPVEVGLQCNHIQRLYRNEIVTWKVVRDWVTQKMFPNSFPDAILYISSRLLHSNLLLVKKNSATMLQTP